MTPKMKNAKHRDPLSKGNLYEYYNSWYLRFRISGVRYKQLIGRCPGFVSREEAEPVARDVLDSMPLPSKSNCRNLVWVPCLPSRVG
jgi:hypothetical protein